MARLRALDIGANRGDWTMAALQKDYSVVSVEPGKIFSALASNFIYNPDVTPLKVAVSDTDNERIEFYECVEDGLSTINLDWLTADGMPYAGKGYSTTHANTITVDTLNELYGPFHLIKIDVEGGEWRVFKGMTKKMYMISFEWTYATFIEHLEQLEYLKSLGYTEIAPQFIEHHCVIPDKWYKLNTFDFGLWHETNAPLWEEGYWKKANLRPTADVGMLFLR